MAKLDMKQAAINHVEKAIFGIVMVVVLLGLIGTKWSPYQGTPGEITQKTRTGENNLIQHDWPEEEQENFPMVKTDNLVDLALYASIDPRPLESSIVPVVDPIGRNEPVTEPVWKTPEDLIASSSVVFLHVAGPADDEESEDSDSESDGKDEASEDDDEDIADELRVRENTPGLGGGSGADTFAGGGYGGGDFGSALGLTLAPVEMDAPEMTQLTLGGGYGGSGGILGEGGGVGNVARPRLNGQGYSFVAVRAVFPLREQISKFVDATHQSYNQAASKFEISDFELQRRTVQKGAEQQPAGEQGWEPVDINVAGDVLESAASFEADVVSSVVTNSVMTMPLPERISGVWKRQASHPRIKNFELTDEQIQLEMEINDGMLQEAVKTNRKERKTEVQRKGFSQFQFDTRDVQGSLIGNDNVFAGGMGGESGGSYGSGSAPMLGGSQPSGFGGVGRRPGARGRRATGTGNTALDELIENLAKREGEENPKEREKLIREWIMSRISVDGELLLFRYFDFSVEPGKTYEYRVRLTLQNPNFGKRIADAGGLAHVVAGKTRTTDWSNVTAPVKVKETTQYFLARLDKARGNSRLLPSAQMNVYHWDSKYGTMVNKAFEVQLGQPIAGEVEAEVIDAAGQEVKEMDYTFDEDSFLVDAIEDISIDRSFHANDPNPALHLNLMRGHRDHFRNEGQVLVKEDEGLLVEHGENGNSKDLARAKKYMQLQKDRTYKHLFDAEAALTDAEGFGEYGDLLGAGGFDDEGGAAGMGMLGGGSSGGRKRTSNRRGSTSRRRGRSGGRSGGGSSSGGSSSGAF